MIDEAALREGLKKLLATTEADIRARVEEEPGLKQALEARHKAAAEAGRTAPGAWLAFRDEAVTQSAVHWLLGCVFVRFLEDNDLIDEAWVSGPKREGRDLLNEALDRRRMWYDPDQHGNDADYLLHVYERTAELPGMAGLFDRKHNPLWSLAPSGPQAMAILRFFQARDEATSELRYDFTDPEWNTRFLGDLYQNLSEFARKRYALCQTPGFVVDFILDRTLTPALDVFGLEKTRLVDPTCGSGHFLLAAFDRLFAKWLDREPNGNPRVLAQRALDAVYGVDINPFAAEIARFRLLISALRVCGIKRLTDAPNFGFQVTPGDSLLHGRLLGRERAIQRDLLHDPAECFYAAEDEDVLRRILGQQYQVVVGNPPYINVADGVLRETYRARYGSCSGKYALSVPFTERFLDLSAPAEDKHPAAYFGLLVSNAFMTRSFGKILVEAYIPYWNLTHVIDCSGAHLPDHGTPTVILLGRSGMPSLQTVRAVRGIRGETKRPLDPTNAPVWRAIAGQVDDVGSESRWVSVADAPRASFHKHPWCLGGGGATELKESLDRSASVKAETLISSVGYMAIMSEDDFFVAPEHVLLRTTVPYRELCTGEATRDWLLSPDSHVIFPQGYNGYYWMYRTVLRARTMFEKTAEQMGKPWYAYMQLIQERAGAAIDPVWQRCNPQ